MSPSNKETAFVLLLAIRPQQGNGFYSFDSACTKDHELVQPHL